MSWSKIAVGSIPLLAILVTLIFNIITINESRERDRNQFTCEAAQRIQSVENVKAYNRLHILANRLSESGDLDLITLSTAYPGFQDEVALHNKVMDDIQLIKTVFWNIHLLCKEKLVKQEVLYKHFENHADNTLRTVGALQVWDDKIGEILSDLQTYMNPLLNPDKSSEDEPDDAHGR